MKEQIHKRLYLFRQLKRVIAKNKISFIILALMKIIKLVLMLLSPVIFQLLIDDALGKKSIMSLYFVCISLLVIFVINFFTDWVLTIHTNRIQNRFNIFTKRAMWSAIFYLPFKEYENMNSGDLKNRLDEDITNINGMLISQTVDYVFNIIFCVGNLVMLLVINWIFAIFSGLMFFASLFLEKVISKHSYPINEKLRNAKAENTNWLYQNLQILKDIKIMNLEDLKIDEYCKIRNNIANLEYERGWKSFFPSVIFLSNFNNIFVAQIFIYVLCGILLLSSGGSVGVAFAFIKYYSQLFENINEVNQKNIALISNLPSIERVLEFLESNSNDIQHDSRQEYVFRKSIEYKNVDFSYVNGAKKALDNITLSINKNDNIAIVGRSGSGKTTLIKILLGLYPIQNGSLKIDGINLAEISRVSYLNAIGVVLQDNYLFNISIRDNLLLAKSNATMQEIYDACKKANIHNMIDALPDKYDTLIGENGIMLSGGQRQLISIAQIILKNPEIIIFDEATSAVDYNSEAIINKTIDTLFHNKTIIRISHRMTSIRNVNKIVIIENGKIMGIGTHNELIQKNYVYKKLYQEQEN